MKAKVLTPEQLTGRSRSHVVDLSQPRCTLEPDTANAFMALRKAAAQAGIDVVPWSSFRDFDRQVTIWNDKFAGRRPLLDRDSRVLDRGTLNDEQAVGAILTWSALPGASRHHWGTDLDVIDGATAGERAPQLVPEEFAPGGPFSRLNDWLTANAEDFGFFRPYDVDRGGVQPEPWHLSYAPLAAEAVSRLTVEVLRQSLRGVALAGGEIVASGLDRIHARYVASVAPASAAALAARKLSPATRPS